MARQNPRSFLGFAARRLDDASPQAPRVLFFSRTKDRRLLKVLEFYAADIDALRQLGFDVRIENRIWPAVTAPGVACFAWWWATAFPVALAWRIRGKRVIVTGASDLLLPLHASSRTHQLKRALTWATTRLASRNIAISDYEASSLASVAAPRVTRLYPGVDATFYRPGPKAESPCAITIGQLNEASIRRKGIDLAIEAVAHVRKVVPSFTLLVAGPLRDDGARHLDRLRDMHDFTGIEILGEVSRERKRDLLASSWLYLQLSRQEGFGLAAVEAMASGTVPVYAAVGSLPEVVGDAGVLVPQRDPAAVASVIVGLTQDIAGLNQLQRRARERTLARYDLAARSDALGEILSGVGLLMGTSPDSAEGDG